MNLRSPINAFYILVFALCVVSSLAAQNPTVREIMAEPSIAGMRVEGEKLSPDGSKVIFLWNAEGKMPRDLYLSSTDKADAKVILRAADLPRPSATPENKLNYGLIVRDDFVKSRENALGNFEWSPDSKKLVFTFGGDLYVMSLSDLKPKRYTKTQSPQFAARFLDNDRITFSQSGNIFVLNTADATLVQLTREANPQNFISVGNVVANKQGTMVAYTVSDTSKNRALFVPNYLDEFVQAPTVRRGWGEQKVFVTPANGSRDAPTEIKLPKAEGVSGFRRMVWTADGKNLIVDRVDKDTKRRQLFYVADAGDKSERTTFVTEETDDKWQAPLSAIFETNPRNANELFFASERDGYNHLYLATLGADGTFTIKQLTKGNWQIEWAKWDSRVDQVFFVSTMNGAASRTMAAVSTNGKVVGEQTTSLQKGMIESPQISTESIDVKAIYGFSKWNAPSELVVQRLCFGEYVCDSTEPITAFRYISKTTPSSFFKRHWIEPKFIDIPSRDGKKIPSKIYLPANHDPKKKYPMAIFVHGAGYLQNTINGWNNYYREFMFNDLLAKKGYVVLDIDYRGSAGYGRDWRTDVYDFLGGKDYEDHIDAIDYMVKNYGVNQRKIAVYGGSYGGFMAGMLVMRAPERIAAAAALRPVFDWKNYYAANPQYTAQRLGFPDKNPDAYKRSSPITYADKLERPLLILHGMADDNVHVQDSQQMIEKLIRLGKTQHFEAMLYPSENHAFARPETWADEYERILAIFEKNLR